MTLLQQRLQRIIDATLLKEPDRIPVLINTRYFPAKYGEITCEDAFYDYEKWTAASKKILLDFQPDMYYVPAFGPGPVYEILGINNIKWPGHGVSPKYTHQFIENEYMLADEYDIFINDPSDFIIRKYLPRIFQSLNVFSTLPPLRNILLYEDGIASLTSLLQNEALLESLKSLMRSSDAAHRCLTSMKAFINEAAELGFPSMGGVTHTAFDTISDYLRGFRGTSLDMHRQPNKLLRAIEIMEPIIIDAAIKTAQSNNNPRVSIMLHKGVDNFMSDTQFRNFYWPSLKRLLLALIDAGITPCAYIEGSYDSRLEYFNELPAGKIIAHFDRTDIFRAKKVIGRRVCICGNIPVSLMQVGSPDEIEDYCARLINMAGEDGGFIMSTGSVIDEVSPVNLKTMIEYTNKHGVY